MHAIDLFCGVGGLSRGLQAGGANVVAGVDLDPDCAWPYRANIRAPYIERDIGAVTAADLQGLWPAEGVRLLAGCAPCQPFSSYANGSDIERDDKWTLLRHFARLTRETLPDLVTMENVPGLARHAVFAEFLAELHANNYRTWHGLTYGPDYGLPQTRTRLVLLASRLGPVELRLPRKPRAATVRHVIASLPPVEAGEAHPDDPLHVAAGMTQLNLKRIRASRPGGTWEDWPKSLRAACHRKASGAKSKAVYGRMEWDAPAPTMTTLCHGFGNGRFGHPEQDRGITLREAALLQSFPKSFKFAPKGKPVPFGAAGRMIGNAVPPALGKVIARSFRAHLAEQGIE